MCVFRYVSCVLKVRNLSWDPMESARHGPRHAPCRARRDTDRSLRLIWLTHMTGHRSGGHRDTLDHLLCAVG